MGTAPLRIYIHHEGEPQFTLALRWDVNDCRSVGELSKLFADAFGRAFPSQPPASFRLATEDRGALASSACVCSCMADGEDVIATLTRMERDSTNAQAMTAPSATSSATSALDETLKPYLEAADKAFKIRQFAKAKTVYSELLNVVPNLTVALLRLGEIETQAGRYDDACVLLERALKVEPSSVPIAIALAKAHMGSGDAAEAVTVLKDACSIQASKTGTTAADRLRTLKIELGRILFAGGARQEGGQLLTEILSQDMEKQDALEAYGEACVALRQYDDALKIFLRMITTRSDNKNVRKMLATSMGAPGSMELLRAQLPFEAKTASALAFLATVVKDFSKLNVACALYSEATKLVPTSASFALNYAHTLEITGRYTDAMAVISAHLAANGNRSVGGVSASQVAALLPSRKQIEGQRWHNPHSGAVAGKKGRVSSSDVDLPPSAGSTHGDSEGARPAKSVPPEELDLLAIFFTTVKILFVVGFLPPARALVALIEPARRSLADLHLTLIRNENAYYCCAAMLLTTLPPSLPPHAPIYVVGDSHSLSPAWRTVTWQGAPRILVPILVTGLKVWHLRDGSEFFPKANFESAVASIPDGADTIFAFGEIDCREGLLLAVERARYTDLNHAISTVISIYIEVLKKLVARRHFTVLVHPVPPVLNETRDVVKQFNSHLEAAVSAAAPTLRWLDFFESMLAPAGDALAHGLELDGTHLHPDYVRLLESSLPS